MDTHVLRTLDFSVAASSVVRRGAGIGAVFDERFFM